MLIRWVAHSKNSVSISCCSDENDLQKNGDGCASSWKAGQHHARRGREERSLGAPSDNEEAESEGISRMLVLLSRASTFFLPSWASKSLQVLSVVLFQTLGFHDAQRQSIATTFSVEKNDLAHDFLLK